ncbi:hypothetical protein MACK_003665 [Theileria orientalis]|uniref:Uncharacterized protein n=1 Tax=Theileria orientalis TaxID=68886 RepID=A0A976SJM0_THEOR|nr:hypothetical protein MACK_003665 [Theileria orientalis]
MPKLSQINQIAPRQNDFEEFRKEVYTILKGGNKNPLVEGHSPSTRSGNTEDSGSKGSVLGSGSEPGLGGSRTHGGALGKGRGGRVETTRLGTSNSLQNSHTRTEPSETRGTPKDHPSKQNTESLPNSHHSGSSEVNLPSTEQERLRDSGVLPAVSPQDSLNSDKGQSDTNHVEDSNDETDPNGDEHNHDSPVEPPNIGENEGFFAKHWAKFVGVGVGVISITVGIIVYKKCVMVSAGAAIDPVL